MLRLRTRRNPYLPFLLICSALACPAQSQTGDHSFSTTSRLVVLDVTVLDHQGQPVTDLNQNDFTVYESGKLQPISNFEAYSQHLLPTTLTQDALHGTADLQRVLPTSPVTILVSDEFNTSFEDTAFARSAIRKYLANQPPVLKQPTNLLAATDSGFVQVCDYTLNREQLLSALAHLKPVLPSELMRSGGSPEGVAIRFAQTLASLQQVADASAGHKGRKNMIWVGRGFDSIDMRELPDHQVRLLKGAAARAINLLQESNTVLYSVDPTLSSRLVNELNADDATSTQQAFTASPGASADPFNGTISFNSFAPETGGHAFALMNNLDEEIGQSVQEGSAYYALAYVPNHDEDRENLYRSIQVKVDRPGVTAFTRRGYYAVPPQPPTRTAAQAKKLTGFEIGTALSSKITYTGLGVLVSRNAAPDSFKVQVNTPDLSWTVGENGALSAHAILAAVAFDNKGKPLAKNVQEVSAHAPAGQSLGSIPFTTLKIDLQQPHGTESIRFVIFDQQSGKMGSSSLPSK